MSRIERSNEKYQRAAEPEAEIEDSCGCVFCDLNLPVLTDRSGQYHETYKHPGTYRVPCTKQS